MHLKTSSAKWCQFCLGLNVSTLKLPVKPSMCHLSPPKCIHKVSIFFSKLAETGLKTLKVSKRRKIRKNSENKISGEIKPAYVKKLITGYRFWWNSSSKCHDTSKMYKVSNWYFKTCRTKPENPNGWMDKWTDRDRQTNWRTDGWTDR